MPVSARLGESPFDCNLRYGGHERDPSTQRAIKNSPLLPGAHERRYIYKGWQLAMAFVEDQAVIARYQKGPAAQEKTGTNLLTKEEIIAILKANLAPGQSWVEEPSIEVDVGAGRVSLRSVLEPTQFQTKWRRDDGMVAFLDLTGRILTLQNTPVVEQFSEDRAEAQQRRALGALPEF